MQLGYNQLGVSASQLGVSGGGIQTDWVPPRPVCYYDPSSGSVLYEQQPSGTSAQDNLKGVQITEPKVDGKAVQDREKAKIEGG